ncbi:hypothetical protein HU200_067629 [Digitaria exilis]|uniref:Uncharacterized protein n=1 Tax=Digitaria exilis TaxID=1010633 RepID=A0A834ZZG5_9POAL|nr:hypothetical protein HU200_067629 [Digitaria exilis]
MACHQRSTSLPCLPYSTELSVEQELQSLKAHISSPSSTIGTACDGLRRLGDVYSCIEEMMCLPSNQILARTMQESLAELKMSIQELRLVLKRRDNVAVQLKIESFVRLAKETAVSILESTSQILPKQSGSPIASKWSLVSKKFQKTKVLCEDRQLEALERSMGNLEDGVEFLFRRLIQSRVAILNILSS